MLFCCPKVWIINDTNSFHSIKKQKPSFRSINFKNARPRDNLEFVKYFTKCYVRAKFYATVIFTHIFHNLTPYETDRRNPTLTAQALCMGFAPMIFRVTSERLFWTRPTEDLVVWSQASSLLQTLYIKLFARQAKFSNKRCLRESNSLTHDGQSWELP